MGRCGEVGGRVGGRWEAGGCEGGRWVQGGGVRWEVGRWEVGREAASNRTAPTGTSSKEAAGNANRTEPNRNTHGSMQQYRIIYKCDNLL